MSNRIYTMGLSTLTLIAGLALATPAHAQLGGVTGSVGGTLDSSLGASTDISSRTRATVRTPQPRARVKTRTSGPTVVTYGNTRSGGYHSHGHHSYHTHTHGYDHFYDDHHHGSHVYVRGEFKSGDKDEPRKDEKKAEVTVIYSKADLLTYGTPVKTQSGGSMGVVNSLQRVEGGQIIGVTVGQAMTLIPVAGLRVEGNVLIHTPTTIKTKGELAFEAQVEMVK